MFEPGTRVQLHPRLDWWMKGARYGIVVGRLLDNPSLIRVRLDLVKRVVTIHEDDLTEVN